jgi:hypothetical protein
VAQATKQQGKLVRKIAQLIALMALAPSAYAAGGYIEVWNPPEARASAPHHVNATHKTATHRHGATPTIKVRARRPSAPVARLATKTTRRENVPAHAPDMSEIPRQITPEGNVLRVGSGGLSAGVMR